MKTFVWIALTVFISSCGALRVSPRGCKTEGRWSEETQVDSLETEVKVSENYFVWMGDVEIKLRDLLGQHSIKCTEVKTIRVEMKSVFFVKRELNVFVTK